MVYTFCVAEVTPNARQRAAERIKAWVARAKAERRLSQEQIAQMLGVGYGQSYVSRAKEDGPNLEDIDDWARIMGIAPEDLIRRDALTISALSAENETLIGLTGSDILPAQSGGVPPGEVVTVPRSFPSSPSHFVLYSFVADLSEDEARQLRREIFLLIEHARTPAPELSEPPAKLKKR